MARISSFPAIALTILAGMVIYPGFQAAGSGIGNHKDMYSKIILWKGRLYSAGKDRIK
jgi:hypothetical protein